RKFRYDNGRTDEILKALHGPKRDGLYNLLLANSPLSDQVLIAFLEGAYPTDQVKAILLANIDFGEAADRAYQKVSLPSGIRKQIDEQRFNHVPYNPVL